MRFDPTQLETLACVAEEGSFDAAARRLHVTPSAVSQRVRALEHAAGQVLVRRSTPSEITDAGAPLLRLAQQWRLLATEAAAELGDRDVVQLPVAVNADSLATWFPAVLDAVATRERLALRLRVEDEGHTHHLLRRGEVMAAVTSEPRPVQGCSVERIGTLVYVPGATAALVERYRSPDGVDLRRMPMVAFDDRDLLQHQRLPEGVAPEIVHHVPSTPGHVDAIRRGLGWGMVPEAQLGDGIVALPGAVPLPVTLHWQRWRLASGPLDRLTDDVRAAARAQLA